MFELCIAIRIGYPIAFRHQNGYRLPTAHSHFANLLILSYSSKNALHSDFEVKLKVIPVRSPLQCLAQRQYTWCTVLWSGFRVAVGGKPLL